MGPGGGEPHGRQRGPPAGRPPGRGGEPEPEKGGPGDSGPYGEGGGGRLYALLRLPRRGARPGRPVHLPPGPQPGDRLCPGL